MPLTKFCLWAKIIGIIILITLPAGPNLTRPGHCSSFGEDTGQDTQITFENEEQTITATLIPRAKSTRVKISFGTANGQLVNVKAFPFKSAAHSDVDHKDFKSGLFAVKLTQLPPNTDIAISVASDFFSKSTEYWVFTPSPKKKWHKGDAANIARGQRVRELTIKLQDGGPLDADGAVNGSVTVIGGPKDSFWGYALGTLFIRFFGIFLVLSILMLGMFASGKFFQYMESRKVQPSASHDDRSKAAVKIDRSSAAVDEPAPAANGLAPEEVAAIAAAVNLHLNQGPATISLNLKAPPAAAWAQQGRALLMATRANLTVKRNF